MKKKTYQKPTMTVVTLLQQHQLLAGSLGVVSNLEGDDEIGISDTPTGDNFWSR